MLQGRLLQTEQEQHLRWRQHQIFAAQGGQQEPGLMFGGDLLLAGDCNAAHAAAAAESWLSKPPHHLPLQGQLQA